MLLPARMTRILLGGHVSRMEEAIQALHSAGVLHLEDYDGEGHTEIGTPLEAGDRASELLVRVRGLQKSLGAEGMGARAIASTDNERLLAEAEDACRTALDEAAGIRTELALLQGEITLLEPFDGLSLDLALVNGLQQVKGYFGTARSTPRISVPHEMDSRDHGSGVALALFVRTSDAPAVEKALNDAGFSAATLPTGHSGTPGQRLAELRADLAAVEARLKAAEANIEVLRTGWGPKLAALEGSLTEEVQKTQAPLRFGVTERTFHAEGWVPTSNVGALQSALEGRLGAGLYMEVLAYDEGHGHAHGAAAAGEHHHEEAGKDQLNIAGHDDHHPGPEDEPPVHLENPKAAHPYQYLLSLLGRPRYGEIDPSMLMLIFFPIFFGMMVGDVIIGALIVAVGAFLKNNKVFGIGGDAISKALIAGGVLSMAFGLVVFGEAMGMHFVLDEHALEEGEISWEAIIYGYDEENGLHGHFPTAGFIHRTGHLETHSAAAVHTTETTAITIHAEGVEEHAPAMFSPASFKPHSDTHLQAGPIPLGIYSKTHDAQALLQWGAVIGFLHIVLGLLIGVRNVAKNHGVALAIQEKAAWLLLIAAVAIAMWGAGQETNLYLGLGVGLFATSVVLLWIGAQKVLGAGFISLLEIPALGGNILSYTRLAAIGASKAGMAIAFANIAFVVVGGGDLHSIAAWIVYILASLLILVLAIIAGTLQSLRLQFVEFFGKFYEGGGRPYVPFGRRAN